MPMTHCAAALVCLSLGGQTPTPEAEVKAAVEAYHRAFERKDLAALAEVFHPELLVFEAGGVDRGREAYLGHHLGPELKELKSWTTRDLELLVRADGAMAYATCSFSYEAAFTSGKTSKGKATETLLLVKEQGRWKIRHLHWSSRGLKPSKT